MIEMGKKYQTRDGRAVRILCVDGPGDLCVCGIVYEKDDFVDLKRWDIEGRFSWVGYASENDLVPVPEKYEATMQWGQCFEPAVYVSDAQSIVLLTDFLKGLPKNVHEIRLIWEG